MPRVIWSSCSSLGGKRTVFGGTAVLLLLLRFHFQAAAQHGNHRMLAVERLGRVEFVARTVQQAVPLTPQKQLHVLLDVVGLDGGLFPPIALAQVMAGKLDVRRPDLQFLVGQGDGVIVAVVLDLALDDLSVAEQQDAWGVRRGRRQRFGPVDRGGDDQEKTQE